jgi:predicted nucleic acid-binding protein
MSNKPIFYDSDVLICFLEIDEQEILKKLFSKVIVSGNSLCGIE